VLEALGITALALTALSALFLVALIVRRSAIAREERRRAELEERVRPLALALVDGQEVDLPPLTSEERAMLAEAIGRLSRNLSGDARERIGAFFAGSEAYEIEIEALRHRTAWRRVGFASSGSPVRGLTTSAKISTLPGWRLGK